MERSAPVVPRGVDPDAWADRFRLACQTCAAHLAGPVVTYNALVDALEFADRQAVGRAIVATSEQRIAATHDPTTRQREQRVIRFVTDLFDL